ncbi:MAG: DUF362 domain-containing protein [Desulfobulbus sp.]
MPPNDQCIHLASQADYDETTLAVTLDSLLAPATTTINLHSTTILLKPNLLTASNSSLACTDARFIVAAARWFMDQGAKVQVGDSPSFGSARGVLHSMVWLGKRSAALHGCLTALAGHGCCRDRIQKKQHGATC